MHTSEVELIRRIRKLAAPSQKKAIVGIGDDAAILEGKEGYWYLFTTDTLVENVHFEWKFAYPYQVGWKALATASSDIAAMGGYPVFALVTLGIPPSISFSTIKKLYEGILDLSSKIEIEISGGDIVRSSVFFVSVSILGEVEAGKAILRSGAKPGDNIYLTGDIGKARTALLFVKKGMSLSSSDGKKLMKSLLLPFPRIKEAREILKQGFATAMIDISDGLSSDLYHIMEESKVGAEIWEENLPVSDEVKRSSVKLGKPFLEIALEGGEDYELLFTSPEVRVEKKVSFSVTKIGQIVEGSKLFLINKEGQKKEIRPCGWDHFLSLVKE